MKKLGRLLTGCLLTSCMFAIEGVSAQSLINGESIDTEGSLGSSQYFSVEIPSQAKNLFVTIDDGVGDADLYVRYSDRPTLNTFDCRPYIPGNSESCRFESPRAGTYSIMLVGFESFSNVELRVSYEVEPASITDDTIDIVTYNIEWLGNPSTAGYNGSRDQQIDAAADDIVSGGGEIYALQEIGGSSALNDLVSSLNAIDSRSNWSGEVSDSSAAQSLAFVYKSSIVTSASFETILTDESDFNFVNRYPFLMRADIEVGGIQKSLNLVNVHLKCCTDSSSAGRRSAAMQILLTELNDFYRTNNVVILGDMNVAQDGGAAGEIADWGTYRDADNDGAADYSHAAGSVVDKPFIPSETESDIDHILISNELRSAWNAISTVDRNAYLTTTVSDHSPVKTSLNISLIGELEAEPPENPGSNGPGVSDALSKNIGENLVATGSISSGFNGVFALVLSDLDNPSQTIVVKLNADQREQWSPSLNPGIVGTTVLVSGKRDVYSSLPSIESVTNITVQ